MEQNPQDQTATTPPAPTVIQTPPSPPALNPIKPKSGATKRLAIAGVAFLLIILGAGGWLALRGQDKPEVSTQTESIKIANIGEYSILNLIAQDQNYFKANGLDATIQEYPSGPPAVTDLLAGKADVAIAADFVGVNNLFNSAELRILSQVGSQENFQLIGLKAKGITKPADIKGKRIAVTRKSAGEFYLGLYLSLLGLKYQDIVIVDAQPADMISQILAGKVDAVLIFEPHAYKLRQQLGDKVVSWSVQGNQKALALAYSTKNVIAQRPVMIEHYLAALKQAEDYLTANQAQAKSILAAKANYDAAYVDYIWPRFKFGLSLRQELLLTMEDEARFAINNGLTKQKTVPNYLDYIYFDGLNTVKPGVVEIIR